ncbi:MAG: hypothetical protein ACR2MB_08450 [Acidimicrobiales bacterium]
MTNPTPLLVGVPTEIKTDEGRVALTPDGVRELSGQDVAVMVQAGAGSGASIPDDDFAAAGAEIATTAEEVWDRAKVKEPQESELGIAYETVQADDGSLPLLAPMSEVAGRMSVQAGAHFLQRPNGGRGVLLGGTPGVRPASVVVLGAGNVGWNAAWTAAGLEAGVDKVTLPYLAELASLRVTAVVGRDGALALGVNTLGGQVVQESVAEALGRPHQPLADILGEGRSGPAGRVTAPRSSAVLCG